MANVVEVASYIYNRYKEDYGCEIDEMKLHKLMYFAQRESFIQNNHPLFDATFYGWKYGPILKEVRGIYKDKSFLQLDSKDIDDGFLFIMNRIFREFAEKDSWSLSRLTHGELSWKNSRIGISDNANSDNPINVNDIKKDAERIKERREVLNSLGLA